MSYKPSDQESKWKQYWSDNQVYKVTNDTSRPKYYVLSMFPYPSGAGLHVGHPLGYIAADIFARWKRQNGFNVLHPMGYDAFGLPAEQYAIQKGVHPAESTAENTAKYRAQLDNIGFNYDWDRAVNTSDPKYYKWTQWIFLQLFDHYFDTLAGKSMPISSLVDQFEKEGNNNATINSSQEETFTAKEWSAYSPKQKDDVLMNYRLAYRKTGYVNWCEALGTVLANDEIQNGVSERGGYPVEKRAMMQWSFRTTAFAERLLKDLDDVDWSDALKAMQANWIGKSQGAQMFFPLVDSNQSIEIFTTRPDTIFGATYMVLAPEHDLVAQITTDAQKEVVAAYLEYTNSRSERERISEVKEVTGAFTGAYATNPISGEKLPVWIGEYVLKDYGTGAIMAVPSDDERDFNFAKKYDLTITQVVDQSEYPNSGKGDKEGKMINSDFLNGLSVKNAIKTAITKMIEMGVGARKINYKLRDANFSRQRYWGEPFPIKYDTDGVSHPLTSDQLPLELPMVSDFKPTTDGNSPLSKASEWVNRDGYKMETNTMPGYAGSSWYFLRYMDPNNPGQFASKEALNYWQDVDLYIGGTEHAVGHLLYSRFVHKFLFDKGLVPTKEPFKKLLNQGMIQGVIESLYLHKDSGEFCSEEKVKNDNDYAKINTHVDFVTDYSTSDSHLSAEGIRQFIDFRPDYKGAIFNGVNGVMKDSVVVGCAEEDFKFVTISEVGKMSKRYHNVVNPDDVVAKYGADCFRMYEMFLGPIEQSKPWDTNGIDGVFKFLRKFWGLFDEEQNGWLVTDTEATPQQMKVVHTCIKKLNDDIARFSFNTGVSAFMICVNELRKLNTTSKAALEPLVRLIAPFAPFIAEELWHKLGNASSVHHADYPIHEDKYLVEASKEYPICFNGKKKILLSIDSGLSKDEVIEFVTSNPDVISLLDGTKPKKVIVVPGRMVNLVV